ncbi:MAG: DUF4388 domain-containing protein [Acidobacteria bacterium]|nr:DUF4388 domain-containing protein [Acidobacteriota bacterium]MCB9399239.1 DUF4388 domain-containing protein [Acidobacteriota bacterium]
MFQGSLNDVKLPDIIQLMSVSSKTGCFLLQLDKEEGRIFLVDGQMTHASAGKLVGEEALYALAIWDHGTFRFEEGTRTEQQSISKKNTFLLMEVARKLDEWRVLSKKIPSLALIPEIETLGNKKVSFNTQEWHVLSKINGVLSIIRIAEMTNLIPIDVAKLIYGLVSSGLVKLRETPKAEPDRNPLVPAEQVQSPSPARKTPDEQKEFLLGKIEKIYRFSKSIMSEVSHPVIQRHCAKGVQEVNQGKPIAAVVETATQIVKASQLLEEPEVTKKLAAELKKIIKET